MALINNIYVQCTDESISRSVNVTEHPVETGLPVTDNVRRKAIELSLSGFIVADESTSAADKISLLNGYMVKGEYVKFLGRNTMSNALINSFETGHTNSVNGGCSFTMKIKEVKIAKKAYTGTSNKTTTQQQVVKSGTVAKRYYTVKSGDCLWNIAKKYYGNGTKWTEIYNANKSIIGSNPNLIYPNQKFLIP